MECRVVPFKAGRGGEKRTEARIEDDDETRTDGGNALVHERKVEWRLLR